MEKEEILLEQSVPILKMVEQPPNTKEGKHSQMN